MTEPVETPPENGRQSWLKRHLARGLGRPASRDIIGAEIGEGARGVVVGKNIIQIGTFVIPTIPVVALLIVAAAGLALQAWRALPVRGPVTMSHSFNVALAEFGQQDASGRVVRSAQGERLSQWVYEAFAAQRDQYPDLKSAVEVWHDSLPSSEKGVTIGFIAGDSTQARSQAAERMAGKIGAHMLIYGNLDAQGRLTPEFYVAPPMSQGADIHGHFQLGSDPIPVDLTAGPALNKQLTTRSLALFWMAMGLSYDRGGLPAEALDALRKAEALSGWQGAGQGKEILYFFIGQAALFQGQDAEAETAFQQALKEAPGYAGALIGLGSVYFTRAQRLQPARLRLETADLGAAFDYYSQAVQAAPTSRDRDWASYAAPLALGMAYRLQGDAYLDGNKQTEAAAAFETASARIQSTLAPMTAAHEYRLLGQAYLALGTAFAQEAELRKGQGESAQARTLYTAARQAYANCIAQGASAPQDQILVQTIIAGFCRPYDKAAETALAAGT